MILVLDNAAYHHWKGLDSFVVGKLKKIEVADKLESLCKLDSITVQRRKAGTNEFEEKSFLSHTWYTNGRISSPTLEELRAALTAQLKQNPDLMPSLIWKHIFKPNQWELLYTPPYLPQVQPIELAWARVKNYVASVFKNGRTMDELREQIFRGMYGDERNHSPFDCDAAQSVIRHSQRECCVLITQDDCLSGDIVRLTVNAPLAVPDEEKDADGDMHPFADEEDEYNESDEEEDD